MNTLFGPQNESSEGENLNYLISKVILLGFGRGETCEEIRSSVQG